MPERAMVRHAVESDIPEVTRIYNHAILNTTATFDKEPKTLDDRLEWFWRHDERHPLLVAEMDGRVVGWGSIRPFGKRMAYRHTVEHAVYVDSDYRGMGIGRVLLDALVRAASEQGHHVMLALVVGGNEASAGLHESLGFELVGTMREVGRKFDRWLDILVYEKILQ